jgi:malonate transporter
MLNILTITGPIYIAIGLGYTATRRGFFSKPDIQALGRFVMYFALPAMLFNALAQRHFEDVWHAGFLWAYGLGSLFAFVSAFAIWRTVRHKGVTESALAALGTSSPNSGYIGYPILLQVLGPSAGVGLALALLVENLLIIPLALVLADAGAQQHGTWQKTLQQSLWRLRKSPMIWSILLGIVLSLIGIELPEVVNKTVHLFAMACSALALFVIGGSLVGMRLSGLAKQVSWIVVGKLVVHPMAVAAVLWFLGPMDASLQISALLLSSMPMLSIYPLIAQPYGLEGLNAATLLTATVVSFFTLSFILWGMTQVPGWQL